MSTTINFYNPGTLDRRAFTMLGLSAKEGDADTKIGFFGTGFKYALAVLLRHKHTVHIIAGKDSYIFNTVNESFRDVKHDFIKCTHFSTDSGSETFELPYTTHLGSNWQVWQAYRELYTNALDEGGNVEVVSSDAIMPLPSPRVNVIVSGEAIAAVYREHGKYFLTEQVEEVCKDKSMRMLEHIDGAQGNTVYYKTMYTGTKLDRGTYFTYDYISKVNLTEERAIADAWSITYDISRLWTRHMAVADLIKHLPRLREHHYEYKLHCTGHTPSEDFMAACEYLSKNKRSMPVWAIRLFTSNRPIEEKVEKVKLRKHEKVQLARAYSILAHHGMSIDRDKVIIALSLPDAVLGYYDREDGNIYIAHALFEQGTPKLIGTLYEEWLHMARDVEDCGREMQNIIIDKCASLMERLYDNDLADGDE